MAHRQYIPISVLHKEKSKTAQLQVEPDELIDNVKALIEVELGIPMVNQKLTLDNKILQSNETLLKCGVKSGTVLIVEDLAILEKFDFSNIMVAQQPKNPIDPVKQTLLIQAKELILRFKTDNNFKQQVEMYKPTLANYLKDEKEQEIVNLIEEEFKKKQEIEAYDAKMALRLSLNPMDIEAQKWLEEKNHQKNIEDSLYLAHEYMPEAFGHILMLYIHAQLNGHDIIAFVDSGAQNTIMSQKCAERCGVSRLIDKRYAGMAHGVGSSRIIGRVHMAQLKIGKMFLPSNLTILEDDKVDFLLGLDLLRRHQCCINLIKDRLEVANGQESVPFLQEGELQGLDINHFPKDSTSPTSFVQPPAGAVQTLLELGFNTVEAVAALKMCNNNVQQAAALLLNKSPK